MRDRNRGFERQPQNFYRTPAWVTQALLRSVRLPNGIWEPCCGDGAMARVLESHGHRVVATDLMDRGYGEAGRDFLMESRLPDGVTAIVTNPPYGKQLLPKIVAHALELTQPVGGMVALLVNSQWPYSKTNSKLLGHPSFDLEIKLTDRIYWFLDADGRPAALPDGRKPNRPGENHCWLVFDHSRAPGLPRGMFADPNAESEPGARWCIECRKPLPLTARADARLCSATCRKRDSRRGVAQRRTA